MDDKEEVSGYSNYPYAMIIGSGKSDEDSMLMNKIERVGELLQTGDFDITDEINLKNYRSKLIEKLINYMQ